MFEILQFKLNIGCNQSPKNYQLPFLPYRILEGKFCFCDSQKSTSKTGDTISDLEDKLARYLLIYKPSRADQPNFEVKTNPSFHIS